MFAALPARVESKSLQLIRDAEIENTIRAYATPLFQASGFNPRDIKVFLVQDPSLNAFVTPGLRMFIHTGLLLRAKTPLQVIGVIAHETGHLAAGDTARGGGKARASSNAVILSYILGLGAALATGRPEAAQAIIAGGQDIALKGLLSYSRGQEAAADQYAVRVLNGTGQSPRGLLEFMQILAGQEVLLTSRQSPYLQNHPLTSDRVAFLEDQVRHSPYADQPAAPALVAMHARMRAKLLGFLYPLERVLRQYPKSDTSLPARYARGIAYFQAGDMKAANRIIDGLIAEHPNDPYFHELKGQMNFESGRIAEAVTAYGEAARLLPDSPQIRLALAQTQIEMNDPALDKAALVNLRTTLRDEPQNSFAWRLSATAYGRQGDIGLTELSMAEAVLAHGKAKEARAHATRAQKALKKNSEPWLRAQDIETLTQRLIAKDEE